MLQRLGPKLWDNVGPAIGEWYWDRPAFKNQDGDGELLYSAIRDAASGTAYMAGIQFVCALPILICVVFALVTRAEGYDTPAAAVVTTGILTFLVMSGFIFLRSIAFTQLAPTMSADGVADDLYDNDDDEDYEEDEEEEDDEEEDEGEAESSVVEFSRPVAAIPEEDDWSDAK